MLDEQEQESTPEVEEGKPRRKDKNGRKKRAKRAARTPAAIRAAKQAVYPRHAVDKALRIPKAILDQNAGKSCTVIEAASFLGAKTAHGEFQVEVSSASKYGFLDRPEAGKVQPTDLARKILIPQTPDDEINGYREAILKAPTISDVYKHYRGENLPDEQFLKNTVVENYKVPAEKFLEFKRIFLDSLEVAQLLSRHGDKTRVVDVASEPPSSEEKSDRIKKLEKAAKPSVTDTCFVMQPFAAPLGTYYELVYKPAIEKAGLTPMRADADIFGTGKIMDQVWEGINAAKVLVAELTHRNPNVFYELGLAHALKKPVVLVSSNEEDVPFDLHHIRVIYYDMTDPFWGAKLLEKVAENILSALSNPADAIFKGTES
jgi:hypothetical protein